MTVIPVVCVVGPPKSGKTTLVEKLIAELVSRGYRVATIKHTSKELALDEPGKDSWRHLRAGSQATILSAPCHLTLYRPLAVNATIEEAAAMLGEEADIILVEGYKHDNAPKLEVHRREAAPPLEGIDGIFAIATDEPLDTELRQFSLEDFSGIVGLLEELFIEPEAERVSVIVNGEAMSLTAFPRDIISRVLMAMAGSLHGVGEIRSLRFSLKRGRSRPDK